VTDAPSRTVQSVPVASLNGLTVLVLEDDAAILTMVQLGFAARGIEVLGASGMAEVQALLARGVRYDAAFVDLSPIQDDPSHALELLKGGDPDLPVILISGSAVAQQADLATSAWVQKPFEVSELCRALADAVSAPKVAAQAS
jgi:DNA-binding NtrC family response regulator